MNEGEDKIPAIKIVRFGRADDCNKLFSVDRLTEVSPIGTFLELTLELTDEQGDAETVLRQHVRTPCTPEVEKILKAIWQLRDRYTGMHPRGAK